MSKGRVTRIPPPTDEERAQVEFAVACGCPEQTVARVMGITLDELKSRFADELELGATRVTLLVAQALVDSALDRTDPSHVAAAAYYLRNRAGWREQDGPEEPPYDEVVVRVRRPEAPALAAPPAAD